MPISLSVVVVRLYQRVVPTVQNEKASQHGQQTGKH